MPENNNSNNPNGLIGKDNLTVEKLHEIFRAAYMKPEIQRDGELLVMGRSGWPYFIQVRENQGFISILHIFGFNDILSKNEKLEAANKLNKESVMVRFCMPHDDFFIADYQLLTKEGVTPFQILNCFTWFDNVVSERLEEIKDFLR